MAMQLDVSNRNSGGRVVGDLGDLQVTENSSDCEDDKICEKPRVSRTVDTLSNIPNNLIQKSVVPVFGSVAITNSDNVQFGNNTYFNGPVTIKQIIQNKSGVENASYTKTDEENNPDAHNSSTAKNDHTYIKKEHILLWHKITFSAVCIMVIGSVIAIVLVLLSKNEQKPSDNSVSSVSLSHDSTDTTVVAFCYDNVQVIIILVILLPLTFMLISYSLLTKENINDRMVYVKNKIHENCLNKYCMLCSKKAEPLLIASDHLRIVSRSDWLAQEAEGQMNKLNHPAPWVIIAHTATEHCYSQSICVLRVRLIQSFHIESRGWSDIGYNFLVGGDGSAYYGRGWDYEGAHTKGYNKYSIGIAFIGTFTSETPPKQQVEACEKLIKLGVRLGKIAKDYKVFAHKQLMSTASPGEKVYNIIKDWPHFVKNYTELDTLIPKH